MVYGGNRHHKADHDPEHGILRVPMGYIYVIVPVIGVLIMIFSLINAADMLHKDFSEKGEADYEYSGSMRTDYFGAAGDHAFGGVPISVALAVSSICAILPVLDVGRGVLTGAQRIFSGYPCSAFLAIPFFHSGRKHYE